MNAARGHVPVVPPRSVLHACPPHDWDAVGARREGVGMRGARLVGCGRRRKARRSVPSGRRQTRAVIETRPPPDQHPPRSRRRRLATWCEHLVLAAAVYIPLLRTAPGMVEDDSKQYLYIDPARFMSQIVSMWNPDSYMGTVTHQYIGYLLPMGPYYVLMRALGVPTWVAQRLWTGSLLFLAGAGVLFLLRTLSPGTGTPGTGSLDTGTVGAIGAMIAVFAYMLSPYVLQNEARQSALLLPWVGLPWTIGLTARALHHGGWRHPALFALVVALVGSTNAVALILVGVGPVLWVVWELLAGRVQWGRALSSSLKIAGLSAAVSLWWAAGLVVEGGYGMDILRYTESIPTVARTSLASETLRGLGYWFFYGVDKLGLYLPMAGPYMTSLWLLAVSFAVPAVAFLAAFVFRWRDRAYFVVLVVVGTILSVGAHPLSEPFASGGTRQSGSHGIDGGSGVAQHRPRHTARGTRDSGPPRCGGGRAIPSMEDGRGHRGGGRDGTGGGRHPRPWSGQFVASNLTRPEQIPSYWSQAAHYLDTQAGARHDAGVVGAGDRLLHLPMGHDARPRAPWSHDPPRGRSGPGPLRHTGIGQPARGLRRRVSKRHPGSRRRGTGPSDHECGRPRRAIRPRLRALQLTAPRALWQKLDPPPPGLGNPVGFGNPRVTAAPPVKYPLIDETELGLPHNAPYPSPVSVFPVAGARPILRTEGVTRPMLLDGDGSGLVAAAGAGLLDGQATVFYSPSFSNDASALRRELAAGADLVVTDTNRRQAEQFGTVGGNFGYTEQAGEKPLVPDDRDARLPLFPASRGDASQTVALQQGVKSVQASGYGNSITYVPENRPDQAMDGDLRTAWTVGAFDNPVGQYLRITLDHPLTTDTVDLVQPLYGSNNRWITPCHVALRRST